MRAGIRYRSATVFTDPRCDECSPPALRPRGGHAVTLMDLPRQYTESLGYSPWTLEPDADATKAAWLRSYARTLIAVDALVLLGAGLLGLGLRFGTHLGSASVRDVPYLAVNLALAVVWVGVLTLSRCYETRFLGSG